MKPVILSAGDEKFLYSVPDAVSDNLEAYCMEFCGQWLESSPDAEPYRHNSGGYIIYCYTEQDFITYLNRFRFPNEISKFIRSLGNTVPEAYQHLPEFDF